MKWIAGFIFLCITTAAYGFEAETIIIGGHDAPEGKYPYQVSLGSPQHFCGGSIINKFWILTVAQCLEGRTADSVTVVAGSNLLNGSVQQSYKSKFIVSHEKYDKNGHINDIGLIRVDRQIELNDKVKLIPIATKDFDKDDYPAILTGWGKTEMGGSMSNKLQEIELPVISQSKCMNAWNPSNITDSHICTLTKAGVGPCFGDAGGPLVADGVQIGILTSGYPCARGKPDVYTRVYTFYKWINEKISQFSEV